MTITRINPPVNGQAITPSSVAATGDVTAVKNGKTYSLGTLGESVYHGQARLTFNTGYAQVSNSAISSTDHIVLQAAYSTGSYAILNEVHLVAQAVEQSMTIYARTNGGAYVPDGTVLIVNYVGFKA